MVIEGFFELSDKLGLLIELPEQIVHLRTLFLLSEDERAILFLLLLHLHVQLVDCVFLVLQFLLKLFDLLETLLKRLHIVGVRVPQVLYDILGLLLDRVLVLHLLHVHLFPHLVEYLV